MELNAVLVRDEVGHTMDNDQSASLGSRVGSFFI